jgi:uroporphyrinogen decarboxylase
MTLSLYGARLTNCPLPEYYTNPSRYVAGQVAVCETFSPDVLFGPFAFAHLGEAFGSTIREYADQAPVIRDPVCNSPEALVDLQYPDPDSDPRLRYHLDAITGLAERYKTEKMIAAILPLPIDIPPLIMGFDAWMETILFDPERTQEVMDHLIPFFVEFANQVYSSGADFIVSPCAFSSPSLVTRDITRNFAVPVLKETLNRLKGRVVIHHGGAPVISHLDLLADLPSVLGYVVDARDNLTDARRIIGPESILLSGPDNLSLPHLTPDEVSRWCNSVLTDRALDHRFILANSGPDIPIQTDPNSIHAFRISVERFSGEA